MLARGRRPLHHAAARVHEGSRDGRAQHRHVPHAGVRRALDRHALAAAQGRRAALPRRRAAEPADAGRGRARSGSRAHVCRHGADARRARRADARRVPPPRPRRAREVRHDRHGSAGQRPDHPRRLRRARRAPPRGAVRRPHRLLLAPRRLSRLPSDVHHAPEAARSISPRSSACRRWRTTTSGWRASGSSCRSSARRCRRSSTCTSRRPGSSTTSCSSRSTSGTPVTPARS